MPTEELLTLDKAIIWARNLTILLLSRALDIKISLSESQDPTDAPPYGYYSFVTPYAPTGELGSHELHPIIDPKTGQKQLLNIRWEHPRMVLSFCFCSTDHMDDTGAQINGENEAMTLALQGAGWFKNEGCELLSREGLVVLAVGNISSRSGLFADEVIRRWGFDVTLRYKAITTRVDDIIEKISIVQKKE